MDPSTDTKCHLGVSDRELRMLFQPSVGFRRWQGARSRVFAQDNCSAVTEVKSGWVSFWLLATFTSQILYLKTNLVLKFRKIQSLAMFIRFFLIGISIIHLQSFKECCRSLYKQLPKLDNHSLLFQVKLIFGFA